MENNSKPGNKIQHSYQSKMAWLKMSELQIEGSAQRPFDPAWAAWLVANFDPDLLGHPVVVMVGNRPCVTDGQHRVAAAKTVFGEDQRIECEVIEGITVARAAQIFRGLNRRKGVTPIANFMTGVTGKDRECVAINQAVEATGWHIAAGLATASVSAVSSLQKIYRLEGNNTLVTDVLGIIQRAWGYAATNTNGDFMVGLAMVLKTFPQIDRTNLTKRLSGISSVARLLGQARALREGVGGSMAANVARVLVTEYNKQRRTGKLEVQEGA